MGTTAATFYPDEDDWDGTDPASGDVRKCRTSLLAQTATSGSCDFGTSGAKTITVDPYTTGRTTTGLDSAFGWAIDIAGADGMDGTSDAKRRIPAGAWVYQGNLWAAPAAALANCTVAMSVYRVAADPSTTRTLLFTDAGVSVPAVALVTLGGTDYTRTTAAQSEILLEPGETIQVTYTLTCTGQLGGLTITFRTGATSEADTMFDVPTGVRTQYQEMISTVCKVAATIVDGTKTVTGVAYDSDGAPASGATVKLFRQSDDERISTYTTAADGAYTFTRADNDTELWYCVGYSDATHHGTSDRSLSSS